MAEAQRTLARPTSTLTGVGLHTGRAATVRLEPSAPGTGLVFKRMDLAGYPEVPARAGYVESTRRCVTLALGKAKVSTVEHVLAACTLAGLDNATIEVEGGEVPAMDGSALPFLEAIEQAGLKVQDAPRRVIALAGRHEAAAGTARVTAEPSPEPAFRFLFRGMPPLDGREAGAGTGGLSARAVAEARTFCYEEEIGPLLEAGLGQGGSVETVLVLRRDGTSVNKARHPEEPLRHKLLDLVGDMTLAGRPVGAVITGDGSGHALHVDFIRSMLEKMDKEAGK